jgi:virginiamycin B lyase
MWPTLITLWLALSGQAPPRPAERRRPAFRRSSHRPRVEALEDRCLLSYTINEFSLPTANSQPNFIAAGPDGNVWFAEINRNSLGRITRAGQITEVPLPIPSDNTRFVFTPDGNIWFGTQTDIAEITPQGVLLHDYAIPSASPPGFGADGISITLGPDGNIWYVEPYTNDLIGRITPDGQITEFPIPWTAAVIITGPDGNLWFQATGDYAIGRSTPDGTIATFNLPNYGSGNGARGLTAGPDGNLWMAADDNQIYRVNTSGQLTGNFAIPTSNSGDYAMTVADGAMWFTEHNANQIGRITTDGSITEIPITTGHQIWSAITTGADGNVWFNELTDNRIGEVVLQIPPASLSQGQRTLLREVN